ncbi:hypothetical protein FH972_025179 [Carpinus fangiana]|uniref:N-acetyltransferase domain-containing protein n=1 Tax=Carpinus fangiana TaxID=176857 RepID=A0A5N6L0M2_9ROSI|nr:hypothetical protein FH972_025179 [Carpinus fangiana]
MANIAFAIETLPHISEAHSEDDDAFVELYRNFRLDALQADPDAFGSSYEEESQRPRQFWRDRLANPKAVHFIARDAAQDVSCADAWLGMIVLLGPKDMDTTEVVSAKGSPWPMFGANDESTESHTGVATYHITGTFNKPSARGNGIGVALLKAALGYAADGCAELGRKQARVTLTVDQINEAATKLYEKVGFYQVGEEWYTPRPRGMEEQWDRLAVHYEMRATV